MPGVWVYCKYPEANPFLSFNFPFFLLAIAALCQIFYGILWYANREDMTINDFAQAFFEVTGRDIPYAHYGFRDLADFLASDHFTDHFIVSRWRNVTIRRANCVCRSSPQAVIGNDLDHFDWD